MGRQTLASHYYPSTTQTVAYTAASAATTNAVGSQTYAVRLVATSDCHYALGAAPTATTSDPYLPSDTVEIISIHPGQKVAVIRNTGDGTAYVTELTQ